MFKSLLHDKEIAVMCALLGVILVLTLFHRQFTQLLATPVQYSLSTEDQREGFNTVGANGPVSQEVINFIRLAAYTRDGQTGMVNILHLDTRKVVNPDTDIVVIDSPLIQLVNKGDKGDKDNKNNKNNKGDKDNKDNKNNKGDKDNKNNKGDKGDDTKSKKLDVSDSERKLLLDIGSRKEGKAHMTDNYLDADEGLNIILDMAFNANDVPANTNELPTALSIQEVSTGKTYLMENVEVTYGSMRPNVLVLHSIDRSEPKDWDGKKYSVIREFIVELYFIRPVSELLTGSDAAVANSFSSLINENLSLAQSSVTYTLYVPEVLGMDQPLYSIMYYLRRGEVNKKPISQVAHEEVKAITDEILIEKVPGIITPLYILDNQITNMEETIGAISNEYLSRQLEERQRQLQFYDTYI